jgi:hypothetical protein
VKRLPAFYSILVLIGPLLIIAVLMAGPFGCGGGGGGGATPVATTGAIEIGLVAAPSPAASPGALFQAIAMNIVSVRLNPSTDPAVADTDPNWVVITAPQGSGGLSTSEVSVNLAELQTNAKVFNTGKVAAQTYRQIEIVVDPNFPGTIIPSCTTGGQEGCVSYPLRLTGSSNLRTTAAVPLASGGLQPVILNINPAGLTPPVAPGPGGNYTMSPTISLASSSFLAPVSGTVSGVPATGVTVTAELTGTNTIIGSVPVGTGSSYTIQLPAAATTGTTYDLYAAGTVTSSTTFDATSDVTVKRSVPVSGVNFSVAANPSTGLLAGTILNSAGQPVVAATVSLLLPSVGSTNCNTDPAGCAVVKTTTSDNQGNYTLGAVPVTSANNYFVQALATGFNTVTQPLSFTSGVGVCSQGPVSTDCSFKLGNTQITGSVTVVPPPAAGSNTVVQVIAEQHGTGNLVGVTQTTVPGAAPSASFSIDVPAAIGADTSPTFDLIASAQDTFLGVGAPFPGHTLGVAADVKGNASGVSLTVECVGHGSINGTANSPDGGTHVRLFQLDTSGIPPFPPVQLMDTIVGQTGTANATQYSFCAPPGNEYTVQRFEQTGPVPSPIGTQQGPITVPTPAPIATSTPCPLCANAAGCPGNCLSAAPLPLAP